MIGPKTGYMLVKKKKKREWRRKGKIFGLNVKIYDFVVENSVWGSIECGFGVLERGRGEK
jgi:hypothetical protein